MRTKEEYYESTIANRKIACDPELTKCPCHRTLCEWIGDCVKCVAIHRFHGDHVPVCMQPLIIDKLKALASVCEMEASEKAGTPDEYRLYVREQDKTRTVLDEQFIYRGEEKPQ